MVLADEVEADAVERARNGIEAIASAAALVEIGDSVNLPFDKVRVLFGVLAKIANVTIVHYLHCDKTSNQIIVVGLKTGNTNNSNHITIYIMRQEMNSKIWLIIWKMG